MMSNLRDVVGAAIKRSSGKSFSEATSIICDAVEAFKLDEVFKVTEETVEQSAPASVISASSAKITELAPVSGEPRKASAAYREYWNTTQIQEMILEKSPAVLSCQPSGWKEPFDLIRIIQVIQAIPAGVLLAYRPNTRDEVSFPKIHLWCNEEGFDFPSILEKLLADANAMYQVRGPIQMRVTTMAPVESRMNDCGTVT